MERQPASYKGNQPVPKMGKKTGQPIPDNAAGTGYSDYDKDEARKQRFREESEKEPWSGSPRDKVDFPSENGPSYIEPISQTDITAKYH